MLCDCIGVLLVYTNSQHHDLISANHAIIHYIIHFLAIQHRKYIKYNLLLVNNFLTML